MQAEEFLRAFPPPESLLLSLLTPRGTVGLLDDVVAARRRNHLLVIDVSQPRDFPDGGPVTPELIGTDRVWDRIFVMQPGQEAPRRLRISVPLEQDVEHETMLVDRPPQPMLNAINVGTDLVQKPAETPPGFPLA